MNRDTAEAFRTALAMFGFAAFVTLYSANSPQFSWVFFWVCLGGFIVALLWFIGYALYKHDPNKKEDEK